MQSADTPGMDLNNEEALQSLQFGSIDEAMAYFQAKQWKVVALSDGISIEGNLRWNLVNAQEPKQIRLTHYAIGLLLGKPLKDEEVKEEEIAIPTEKTGILQREGKKYFFKADDGERMEVPLNILQRYCSVSDCVNKRVELTMTSEGKIVGARLLEKIDEDEELLLNDVRGSLWLNLSTHRWYLQTWDKKEFPLSAQAMECIDVAAGGPGGDWGTNMIGKEVIGVVENDMVIEIVWKK